jgi:hypothetical protein
MKPEVWVWMCHLSCVLNEDTWIPFKFWWSSLIGVGDLTYHEEGWVMLLHYFVYVVLTSLLFNDAISLTVMWHLRFANCLFQYNPMSVISCTLSFISNVTILSFDDLCYSSPGMWVQKCITCSENAVLFFPFQVRPWRMWEVEYICYILRLPAFMAMRKYGQYILDMRGVFAVVYRRVFMWT